MSSFRGKLALITGASSGIGEALALALAAEGAQLILSARDEPRLAQVRARCEALGARVEVYTAEVSNEAQMQAMADAIHARHAALDILINNAGVVMGGLCWQVEAADWRRLHEINVMGVVHAIRAFVPRMVARRSGHVVNMASVSGYIGAPGMATYSASKFAVMGLTESLRRELRRHGVGVTAVCPGFVKTPIQSKVKLVGDLDTPTGRARVDRDFARTTLTAEQVATRTLKAIRRKEAVASIGREALMANFAKRWMPGLLDKVLG